MKAESERTGTARRGAFLAAMAGVLALGIFLRLNAALWRPLEHDEISSANAYTSIGYISTISQLRAEPRWNVSRLAAGLARTFIDWRALNNHVVQELGVSLGVFFLGASEATVRAAALAASVSTALLLMVWAKRHTGSCVIAGFCGLAVAVNPYFIYYGQTARGYSFTTLMLVTHILLLDEAVAGKRGFLRLSLSILVGFGLFLNMTSSLFAWLVPLYACMLWREAAKPAAASAWRSAMAAMRSEAFCWWLFQASAVGGLLLFFVLEHLPVFLRSQGDYGVKLASAGAAVHGFASVIRYLFPGQWILLALAGVAGWFCLFKSRYWLASPMAGSVVAVSIYALGTKTIPYDRTFGIWIVFAIMACAWLWKQWRAVPRVASSPAILHLPAVGACALIVSAMIWRHSMLPGPDYGDAAQEISREIQSRGETSGNAFIIVPFNCYEECRLYLPDDSGFVSLAAAPPKSLPVYLPCKSADGKHDGVRCTYYHRSAAEMVYFQLPESWSRFSTWRDGDCSVVRLNTTVSRGAALIAPEVPQIVVWQAASSFFDLDSYVNERLLKNPKLPEFRFVRGYYFPTPTLIFFLNGEASSLETVLAGLDAVTPGSVTVLTPAPQ